MNRKDIHAKIIRLAKDGKTTREIIEATGVSKQTVYNVTRKAGLMPALPSRTPPEIAKHAEAIFNLRQSGVTVKEISKQFKCTRQTVHDAIAHHKRKTMARPSEDRQMKSYRFRPETSEAATLLLALGYDTQTDAIESAICQWHFALSIATREVAEIFVREEWNYLADVMNAPMMDGFNTQRMSVNRALALEAWDGHHLNQTGRKWFETDPDKSVEKLVAKLDGLTHAQSWAVLLAVSRFWKDTSIDAATTEWWKV